MIAGDQAKAQLGEPGAKERGVFTQPCSQLIAFRNQGERLQGPGRYRRRQRIGE